MVVPTSIPRSLDELRKMRKEAWAKSFEHCQWMSNIKDPANYEKYQEQHFKEMKQIHAWASQWELKLVMGVDKRPVCLR